jgi:hypothetical protein
MTSLLGFVLVQIGNFGKTEPCQMASPVRQNRDVCSLFARKGIFAFIRA